MGREVPSQQTWICHLCEGPTDTDTHDSWLAVCVWGRGTATPRQGLTLLPPALDWCHFQYPGAGQSVFRGRDREGRRRGKETPPAAAAPHPATPNLAREPKPKWRK